MTEVRAIGRDQGKAEAGASLRVVVVLDPTRTEPMARPARAGVEVRLNLAELGSINAASTFLSRADMLILEVDLARAGQFDEFGRIVRELADRLPVVAACRSLTVADTRRLMRQGAIGAEDFEHAIEQASRFSVAQAPAALPAAGRDGKVISFIGAVGGVGATALATQAGCLWAGNRRVCLIDLDIQFGSAALYLDMKPQLNIIDLTEAGERLDAEIFSAVAAQHDSGLHVIAGPSEMMPLEIMTPAIATQILRVAKSVFDLVIIDLPAAWTNWSMTVLSQSDVTVMVTSLTVPGIHQARRKLDLMDANELPSRIVLNRVARKVFRTIDLGDTEKVLRRKVDYTIANDFPTVSGAIDQGRTLAAVKANSRVEKDLAEMVEALSAVLAAVGE